VSSVPKALSAAQLSGRLPPITAVYVESIEGSAKRGPSRRASLTTPDILRRLSNEITIFLAERTNIYVVPSHRIVVGHSLGVIAALYLASRRPRLCRHVVALSAALWWPGESVQMSGQAAIDLALRRVTMGVWLIAGAAEEQQLLESNGLLCKRLLQAGRTVTRVERPGSHELRPADVVDGIAHFVSRPTEAETAGTRTAARGTLSGRAGVQH
jgi:enterochelin esterase-like enzyme